MTSVKVGVGDCAVWHDPHGKLGATSFLESICVELHAGYESYIIKESFNVGITTGKLPWEILCEKDDCLNSHFFSFSEILEILETMDKQVHLLGISRVWDNSYIRQLISYVMYFKKKDEVLSVSVLKKSPCSDGSMPYVYVQTLTYNQFEDEQGKRNVEYEVIGEELHPKLLTLDLFEKFLKNYSYGTTSSGMHIRKALQKDTEPIGIWFNDNIILCDFNTKTHRNFYGVGLLLNH